MSVPKQTVHVQQKDKRSNTSKRKAKALGENDNTFSMVAYYNPMHGRLEGAMWVPEGEPIPDMDALTYQLWLDTQTPQTPQTTQTEPLRRSTRAKRQVAIKRTQAGAKPEDQRRSKRRDKAMARARTARYIARFNLQMLSDACFQVVCDSKIRSFMAEMYQERCQVVRIVRSHAALANVGACILK